MTVCRVEGSLFAADVQEWSDSDIQESLSIAKLPALYSRTADSVSRVKFRPVTMPTTLQNLKRDIEVFLYLPCVNVASFNGELKVTCTNKGNITQQTLKIQDGFLK